jgi:hypothetical protein
LTGGRGPRFLAKRCAFVSRFASLAASTGTTVPKRATEATRSNKANLCIMNEWTAASERVEASCQKTECGNACQCVYLS